MMKIQPEDPKPEASSWLENLSYPSHPIAKWAFKSPLLLYRLGLGFLVGRLFMVMTTSGRKSGLPRHMAIEFHEHNGRKYVFSAWGEKSDWYHNIQADPRVTIQTWHGAESVLARRITSETELAQAFEFAAVNPTMRKLLGSTGFEMSLDSFLAQKDSLIFVTFDATDQPTLPAVVTDLCWLWLVLLALLRLRILIGRQRQPQ